MGELTEFQKKRLENIKRNNDLLKKLQLHGAASQIKKESGVDTLGPRKTAKLPARKTRKAKIDKVSPVPIRRSSRIRGEKVDGEGIPNVNDNQLLKLKSESSPSNNLNLEEIKNIPVIGDVKLSDILAMSEAADDEKDAEDVKKRTQDELMSKFQIFANKNFSSGDFFEVLKENRAKFTGDSPELEKQQQDYDLVPYDVFPMNDIKLTYERINSMYFHPSIDRKLIIGGDTGGTVGFWNVRDEPLNENGEDDLVDPDITRVKLFTKSVSKIDCLPNDMSKIIIGSYDGTLRTVDMNTLQSDKISTLVNEYDDIIGISDCQFSYDDPNLLYMVTLSGEFLTYDVRIKNPDHTLKRLSDKKIGSMSINPKKSYEIATGSLDRTLKVWDLRKTVQKPDWSQYDDFPSHQIVATYDSRLSVSSVSYSCSDDTIVCNGYDDTIRLFDADKLNEDLEPRLTMKHNCQTGRWTSILKAKFKPNENVFGIANMGRAIDIYNSKGEQLAHLSTPTVPAVLAWHPFKKWIVGGNSSGKGFLFLEST